MPAARRQFGSIRKLPSGRWQASYWHLWARHLAGRTFRAKGDATAWLSTVEADILRGAWVDPAGGRTGLGDYSRPWLTRRTDLRPATRAKYNHLLENHILPMLGGAELARLQPSAVREWYLELRGRHPTTADDAYRLLRAILNTAVADSLVLRSPAQVKGAGQVRSAERPVASVAEVTAAVQAVPDRVRLAVLPPAWCQLRRGEVLGLQRRDVDLLHGTIRVERAWTRPMGGQMTLGDPKTTAGTRTLAGRRMFSRRSRTTWTGGSARLARRGCSPAPTADRSTRPVSTGPGVGPGTRSADRTSVCTICGTADSPGPPLPGPPWPN